MNKKTIDEWRYYVEPALLSKVNELKIVGYAGVTTDELWGYLKSKVWQLDKQRSVHEVIQDILRFAPSDYINHITVKALTVQGDKESLMESIRALTEPQV